MMSVGDKYPKIRSIHSNSDLTEIDTATSPAHSPQRDFSPNSRNSSPGSRSSEWHRTSFKVGKAKPSKTRYMKKSEIIGVVLSAVLSLIFAISIVVVLYYGTPLVIDRVAGYLDLGFGTESTTQGGTKITVSRQSVKLATRLQEQKAIKVVENLSGANLRLKYIIKQEPVVFTLQTNNHHNHNNNNATVESTDINTCNEKDILTHLSSLQNVEISLRSMRQFYQTEETVSTAMPFQFNDFLTPGLSVNIELLEDKSYFGSSAELASRLKMTIETSGLSDVSVKNMFNGDTVLGFGKDVPQLSGTPFHVHKHSLNYLASGRKHWVLFKYDKIPAGGFNPLQNLQSWLSSSNDSTIYHEHVLHVFQETGQYVFIPEGWYHATETLSSEGSVSISYRAKQASSGSFMQYYLEGKERYQSGDYAGSIRMLKLGLGINRNALLLDQLAEAYIKTEAFLAAEEILQEVLQLNPRNAIAYSKLISLLINHATRDISESISELLEQADIYHIRNDVLALSHDVL